MSFKISPFSLITPNFSTVDVAFACEFDSRHAIEVRYGQKVDLFNASAPAFKFSGFKTFIEFQRKFARGLTGSIEIGRTSNHDADSMTYHFDLASAGIRDGFDYRTVRYSITPKVTWVMHSSSHFQVEAFAGVGWKRSIRSVFNLEFDADAGHFDPREREGFADDFHYVQGGWTSARVALGMNFCYVLGWSKAT